MINALASTQATPLFMTNPISSTYLVILRRYISHLHQNKQLNKASSDSGQADYYVESTIHLDQISPVLREIEMLVGHKAFGLDIGRHMHPSEYGVFGYALMNCKDIHSSLQTAAKYKSILNQNLQASFFPENESNNMVYQVNSCIDSNDINILIELDFSTALQFGMLLIGPHKESELRLESVHFKHAPNGPVHLYEERFQCPVYFHSDRNALHISRATLETPIYAANDKILTVLQERIEHISQSYRAHDLNLSEGISARKHENISQLLTKYVQQNLSKSNLTANDAAELFNISLSTLKKRLREEGTCFQEICNKVRYQHCIELMKDQGIAIKQIAFDLGFANPSAFNRAFKRWTGDSPANYRKTMANKQAT